MLRLRKLLSHFLFPLSILSTATTTAELPPEMDELLQVCEVHHNGDLSSIAEATKNSWLRKPGKERWQIDTIDYGTDKNQRIRELVYQLGFIKEVPPTAGHYKYCLIGGAVASAFQKRLLYVRSLWEKGLRYDQLIILTGERALDAQVDKSEIAVGCKTEAEALQFVYENSLLPTDMRAIPYQLVVAPNKLTPSGVVRPSRGDTVLQWLSTHPSPGDCMFVTHQPYVQLDQGAIANVLGPDYPFVTVGPGTDAAKNSIALLLDTVGRCLLQQFENEKPIDD